MDGRPHTSYAWVKFAMKTYASQPDVSQHNSVHDDTFTPEGKLCTAMSSPGLSPCAMALALHTGLGDGAGVAEGAGATAGVGSCSTHRAPKSHQPLATRDTTKLLKYLPVPTFIKNRLSSASTHHAKQIRVIHVVFAAVRPNALRARHVVGLQ